MPQAPTNLNELGLFTGAPQHEHFDRLKTLLPVSEMKASTSPRPFPEGASAELPKTYANEGQTRVLAAFFEETHTSALLILKDGEIRLEQYWLTGGRDVQWISFSVAKSFVSALVGIAMAEGVIRSVEDPIDAYVHALKGSAYEDVRIKDVLQMSSGARWNENYDDPDSEVFGLRVGDGSGRLARRICLEPRERARSRFDLPLQLRRHPGAWNAGPRGHRPFDRRLHAGEALRAARNGISGLLTRRQ